MTQLEPVPTAMRSANSPARRKAFFVTTADGVEIAVQEWGDPRGREIIFIHGFSLSHLCWSKQVTDALAGDFRIVTYDLRGHGSSGKPHDPRYYREGARWADELALVIARSAMRRPLVVAWSYGGRIVADYLRRHGADKLAGLNIVGAKTNSDPAFAMPAMAAHQLGMASPDLETNIRSTIAFVEGCARAWVPGDFAMCLAMAMVVPHEVRAALLGRPLDADDLYGAIGIPVLFSHGAVDPIAPAAASRYGHAITPGSRLSVYEHSGHAPFIEEPARFNRELAEFAAFCNP